MVSELVKCCSRRVFRFEAVLVVDHRYVIGDVGEDDFFKELGCWGQEGNGSFSPSPSFQHTPLSITPPVDTTISSSSFSVLQKLLPLTIQTTYV